jgi:hypothetical protein
MWRVEPEAPEPEYASPKPRTMHSPQLVEGKGDMSPITARYGAADVQDGVLHTILCNRVDTQRLNYRGPSHARSRRYGHRAAIQ